MIQVKGCFLHCFAIVVVALVSIAPSVTAIAHDDDTRAQLAARVPPPAGFRKLSGQQIQRLVIALGVANHPDSDQVSGNSDWVIHFKRSNRADRGKVDFKNAALENYGTWHVKRDKLCIRVKGSDSGYGINDETQPHHGCFAVYVHLKRGEVIAYMPRVKIYRFLMADNAEAAIAKVLPK